MAQHEDPNTVQPADERLQLKFDGRQALETLIRAAYDTVNPSTKTGVRTGTLASLFKTFKLDSSKERDAFRLIATSMVHAIRNQLREQLDQMYLDENKQLVVNNHELRMEALNSLSEATFDFDRTHFRRPEALPILDAFVPAYAQWLRDNYGMTQQRAGAIAAGYPITFASAFCQELATDKYKSLLAWRDNQALQEQIAVLRRQSERHRLQHLYFGAALGEDHIALADMYIEPNFRVAAKQLSKSQQEDLQELERNQNNSSNRQAAGAHFLRTTYPHSIHDYFRYHFLPGQKSEHLDWQNERAQARLLILLGQPGHGKSSFCYRTMHDLLTDPHYRGSVHFVRLRKAAKNILDDTADALHDLIGESLDARADWKNPTFPSVLFLDGLDELCMAQVLSNDDINRLLDNCSKMVERYEQLFIVVTSRFNYLPSNRLRHNDAQLLSLDTLELPQQQLLINKFVAHGTTPTNIDLDFLKEINKAYRLKHIKELIELPILLQMILLSGIDLQAADSRAKVYDQLFTQVLDRKWSKDRRLKLYRDANDFQPEDLRKYLGHLAWRIYQTETGYLNRKMVDEDARTEEFKNEFLRLDGQPGNLQDLLRHVLTSFYLQETAKASQDEQEDYSKQDYAIEFMHKSLYEYLCCEHLWERCKELFLKPDGRAKRQTYREEIAVPLQKLLAKVRLSREMLGYLREIIDGDTDPHPALQAAMTHILEDLMRHGFIYRYPLTNESVPQRYTPRQQALHIFHGYWAILGPLRYMELEAARKQFYALGWSAFQQKHLDTEAQLRELDSLEESKNKETINNLWQRITQERLLEVEKAYLKNKVFHAHFSRLRPLLSTYAKQKLPHLLRAGSAEQLPLPLILMLACLNGADLHGADLRGADVRGADLHGADLRGADLRGTDLSGANLSGAYLSGTDLSGAYLSGAYLSGAYLSGAYLRGAYLRGAYLYKADLSDTVFRGANLSGADLSSADLTRTNLSRANIHGADLRGAVLSNAYLSSTYLSDVILNSPDQLDGISPMSRSYIKQNFIVATEKSEHQLPNGLRVKGYRITRKEDKTDK